MSEEKVYRNCGSCKKPINVNTKYYVCSISTCRKSAYCSMPCFDDHIPILKHKDAWAEERTAPAIVVEKIEETGINPSAKTSFGTHVQGRSEPLPKDILVVASKLKNYIRTKSGLNTSASVLERLSDILRLQCDKAIQRAQAENRKTVLDRDFYL